MSEAEQLVDVLLSGNGLGLLVELLGRLDETVPEEAAAVHGIMSIIENMVEVRGACGNGQWQGGLYLAAAYV